MVAVANVKHHVSQLAKHLAQLETKNAKRSNRKFLIAVGSNF